MNVEILSPHGFCAGVVAALKKAFAVKGRKIYGLHELVHNEIVAERLVARGFVFVETLDEVPDGATVLFSAHGTSPAVRSEAARRNLDVIDATCPFVAKVHKAVRDFAERGLEIVVIGHADHAEVKGIVGEAPAGKVRTATADTLDAIAEELASRGVESIAVVSQTTMNSDEVAAMVARLKERFNVNTTAEVCHATKERQDAVKAFDGDAILVLGSARSSNTNRLCEVARVKAFRAGTMDEVRRIDFSGIRRLGVTGGASTPEDFLDEVVLYLRGLK
ncbi:MAG: 4-hydroxy-3-methylbut-2-enyl diphosphate reductase [Kiritimatiellae bacterium]|nr:4-hydroxy-3-methylbut-2-enyl diphosphate reductase [Kiritimatiellia bacterium]